jgi:hypothetical protein
MSSKIVNAVIAVCFFAPLVCWVKLKWGQRSIIENAKIVDLSDLPFLLFAFGIGLCFLIDIF